MCCPSFTPLLRHMNSVAFITGRKEAQRNSTAANLEAAGYGRQCRKGELFGPRSQGLEAEGWQGRRPMAACYAALHLRNMDDDRCVDCVGLIRRLGPATDTRGGC